MHRVLTDALHANQESIGINQVVPVFVTLDTMIQDQLAVRNAMSNATNVLDHQLPALLAEVVTTDISQVLHVFATLDTTILVLPPVRDAILNATNVLDH